MRVALIGGTGFVGSYLVDQLVQAGHQPVVLVRPGSEARLRHADVCEPVDGDLADAAALDRLVQGTDAVIYNVGILRENPSQGITFDELQRAAPARVMQAAKRAGVRRFLLMSANGVAADSTPYQSSKLAAERELWASDLDGTVFRPSVIFGDPRGRDEFASALARDIIAAPLPAPLFFEGLSVRDAGGFRLSPVHVGDVAAAFVKALSEPDTIGQTLELGGPEALSWRDILGRLAGATGRRKLMLPAPAIGIAAAATLLDRFDFFPITRDQLRMLLQGNTCSDDALRGLGIEPTPFDSTQLAYLQDNLDASTPCRKNAA
jgi:NADH dehydrogenase